MQIRDIINRDVVNLSNCDEEPIHIPGSIQPHGFLLALDAEGFHIKFCSGNVDKYLNTTPADILQKTIDVILGEQGSQVFKNYITVKSVDNSAPLVLHIGDHEYSCTIHKSNGLWIAEFEPQQHEQSRPSAIFDQTVNFVRYMQQSQTLKEFCSRVAHEIKSVTGYDRVMIYRFDEEYNGEVFAESKRPDLESFLGLHYPHTDIPVQARQLYIKNLLRLIADMSYEPVPIYTAGDADNKSLDLSFSMLRSVSPIHVQYLQNMGVEATLTISLMHEGKLWGLVACHHYSPRYIDHHTRLNAQLQGHFLTSQINIRQQAEEFLNSTTINEALKSILNISLQPQRASLEYLSQQPQLLGLCNAEGAAIILDEQIYKQGNTPSDKQIKELAIWAFTVAPQGIFSSSKLATEYPDVTHFCSSAAGIIFYSLLDANSQACIIWFNSERLEEVSWGGDPSKAIIKDEKGLHPRKSFEIWKEVVKCKARDWTKTELSAAGSFAYALQKHVSLILLTEEDSQQRHLTNQLKEINAELENINWIGTHDLKEPLRKIQIQSSRLLSREKNISSEVAEGLTRMNKSANRMQQLINDLTSYGKVSRERGDFVQLNLEDEIARVLAELHEEIDEKNAKLIVRDLPQIKGVPVLVRQLLMNLLSNSLKFSSRERAPEITIAGSPAEKGDFQCITVTDNGVGFEDDFAGDIFKIFMRLHDSDYDGSGIGLSLCKKIMQIHKGDIVAKGRPGEGATFTLCFPRTA